MKKNTRKILVTGFCFPQPSPLKKKYNCDIKCRGACSQLPKAKKIRASAEMFLLFIAYLAGHK